MDRMISEKEQLLIQMLLNTATNAEQVAEWIRMTGGMDIDIIKPFADRANTRAQDLREAAKKLERATTKALRVNELLTECEKIPATKKEKTLEQAIDEYLTLNPRKLSQKTIRNYKAIFNKILKKCEGIKKPLAEINETEILCQVREITGTTDKQQKCRALIRASQKNMLSPASKSLRNKELKL